VILDLVCAGDALWSGYEQPATIAAALRAFDQTYNDSAAAFLTGDFQMIASNGYQYCASINMAHLRRAECVGGVI
jgi:hypothetical protein